MQTAVITGGAGGMGLAVARILGGDHRIFLADLGQERIDAALDELTTLGIDASGMVSDITDRSSVEAMLDAAEAGGHHVRALVHTAGISPQMGSADRVIRVNGTGTVNVTQTYLRRVREGDVLVNVASVAGQGLPRPLVPLRAFQVAGSNPAAFERAVVSRSRVLGKKLHSGLAYSMSKMFVIWYSRQQAGAFGARGARLLSVSPGSFDTAMGRLESDHGAADILKKSALKRFGKPEEIAAVLAFCASEAPGYLTGVDILVDGGTRAGQQFAKK